MNNFIIMNEGRFDIDKNVVEKSNKKLINKKMEEVNMNKGCYVIDKACGRGKTTQIREFIIQHYDEGILYCVDSLAELHKMYDSLYGELVKTGKICHDDMVILTSENTSDARDALYDYHSHPEGLFTKKILLITHVRFFSSLINYFVIYKPITFVPIFDGNFRNLLTRNDLRQWIFFDETPMWIRPFCTLSRSILGTFSEKSNKGWTCMSPSDIEESYNRFIKHTRQDPFKHQNQLDRLEKQSILSLIPSMYQSWMALPPTQDISIYFRPKDLAVSQAQTHILFFEGAADLLLQGSPFVLQPTHGKKYDAYLNFFPIPFPTERGANFDGEKYGSSLQSVIEIIARNSTVGRKTLVCVWKSEHSSKEDIDGANTSRFRDWVGDCIKQSSQNIAGFYSVIYYGESRCKSCNDFMDYSSIILFGRWFLPDSRCDEHNHNWGTTISPLQFHMWFYVQLISRIGIRRHDNCTYEVFYTSDFDPEFINHLNAYFNADIVPPIMRKRLLLEEDLPNRLRTAGIKREHKEYITKLCDIYPNLREHILDGDNISPFKLNVSAELLKEILPNTHRNFNRSLERLTEALKRLNVILSYASDNVL